MAAKKKRTYREIMNAKEVLGLPSYVTAAAVKKRHRELVKAFHPDTCGMAHDANEARIREINEAIPFYPISWPVTGTPFQGTRLPGTTPRREARSLGSRTRTGEAG